MGSLGNALCWSSSLPCQGIRRFCRVAVGLRTDERQCQGERAHGCFAASATSPARSTCGQRAPGTSHGVPGAEGPHPMMKRARRSFQTLGPRCLGKHVKKRRVSMARTGDGAHVCFKRHFFDVDRNIGKEGQRATQQKEKAQSQKRRSITVRLACSEAPSSLQHMLLKAPTTCSSKPPVSGSRLRGSRLRGSPERALQQRSSAGCGASHVGP